MWYRIGATRNLTGGRKITPTIRMNEKIKKVREEKEERNFSLKK